MVQTHVIDIGTCLSDELIRMCIIIMHCGLPFHIPDIIFACCIFTNNGFCQCVTLGLQISISTLSLDITVGFRSSCSRNTTRHGIKNFKMVSYYTNILPSPSLLSFDSSPMD